MAEELKVENLSKKFGALEVVKNLTFSIYSEERRVVIIGPNGAGKTTLFNLISGELSPSRGNIFLFGSNVTKMPCYRRTKFGLARTFQTTDLFPYFTLTENLLLALQVHDPCKYQMLRRLKRYHHLYEKAEGLLRQMKLWEKKDLLIDELSHGETRLVEILLGIAGSPKMLLLDEPMAGLTYPESIWLSSIIQDLLKDVTLIIIEHDINIAFDLAERIIVMHQGEIIADGKPEEIRLNQQCREIYLGIDYSLSSANML
jgi:branched-chain amino acid transport system ATP-binding protein